MTPQCMTLLAHLSTRGSITDGEARLVHRIRALPRRISDLEDLGYDFVREQSIDAAGGRYVRYYLMPQGDC